MATTISKITIRATAVTRAEGGKYQVYLTWMLNDSPAISCPGDYDIILIKDAKDIETKTASNANNKATVIFDQLTSEGDFSVKVRAPQALLSVESAAVPLVVECFKGFSGHYDGTTLLLTWVLPTTQYTNADGTCVINSDNGFSTTYALSPGLERAVFDIACGRRFTVQATSKQASAEGPKSDILTFYTAPPFITDAKVTSNKNGGTDIDVAFTSEHDDIKWVSLVLSMDGEKVYESEPVEMTEPGSNYHVTVNVAASELVCGEIEKCTVSCVYVNGSAKSVLCGDGSEMPLARPSVNAVDVQGGKTVMRISYPENASTLGFELSDGKSVVSGNTYTVDLTAQTPAVRPRFDRNGTARRGVSSEPAPGFIPGYYVSSDSLVYRGADFSQKEVTHTWSEELFTTPLEGTIKKGALQLEFVEKKYILTISNEKNLVEKDYNDFIDEIIGANKGAITPYGFYALTDVILRVAPQAFNDTPYLLCAYDPDKQLVSDIRPGLRLTVDTALYMQQPNSKLENAAGFVSVNNAGWNFALNNAGSFLEPDLFMGQMVKISDGSLNAATKVTYAAGAADFMRPSMHQPYYRVLFPASLELSMAAEDPFPSDNAVIMASDSYGAILDACEKIGSDAASINQLDIPLMIFRGRSAFSLSMPIQINGNICHVPVGCSVSQALSMHGYGSSASIKMMREDDNRVPRPVFLEEDARFGKMALIPGDRLEVQYENPSD